MISLREYLEAPCRALSIPYWKGKRVTVPECMRIVHREDFHEGLLAEYTDEPYFRLMHTLEEVPAVASERWEITEAGAEDLDTVVSIINHSYSDISVTREQMLACMDTPVYDPSLWLIVRDRTAGQPVGCAIADLDREVGEGVLEWVQVLPGYRGQGIGKLMVCRLLSRLAGRASFATVSGRVNNVTDPQRLYRSCGFAGSDVWHILVSK